MDRELALEFVRVTETAALAAGRLMGRGDKNAADQAAVEGMRAVFDTVSINGTVVIGEGEMDEAPMLYIGEKLGCAIAPELDIAVDPLEGTNLVAKGLPNAIAVLAAAPKGCLLNAPDMYMEKIAVGPKAAGRVCLTNSVTENLRELAKALDKDITEITAILLDRPRHYKIMEEIRQCGARIKLITDGDVSAAIATAIEDTGIDIMFGTGGAPEGVLAAAALKCMGGELQGRLVPENDEERNRAIAMGITDLSKVLMLDDLVKGNEVFFTATGITDGDMLRGVRYPAGGKAITHSLIMRGETGTVRFIEAIHTINKKPDYIKNKICK